MAASPAKYIDDEDIDEAREGRTATSDQAFYGIY